jgi:hypothetical protein
MIRQVSEHTLRSLEFMLRTAPYSLVLLPVFVLDHDVLDKLPIPIADFFQVSIEMVKMIILRMSMKVD